MDKPRIEPTSRTAVSTYDRVSSWLIAMIVVFGTLVWLFFLIWLTSRDYQQLSRVIHPTPDDPSGIKPLTKASIQTHEPQADELPEISHGQAEIALTSVNEAVSRTAILRSEYDGMGSLGDGDGDGREKSPP